jgi:aspartyl-tRNA(Asn)/glutamyl-tRNA(Gln) amidotransferase subunit B
VVDAAWQERVRASIGELPAARRRRFETEYGLSAYDANVLVEQGQDVADYYDAVSRACGDPKLASNWVQQDILRTAKEKKLPLAEFPVRPEALAELIGRVGRRELNTNQGREVLARMIESGESAEVIIASGGFGMVADEGAIVAAVEAALAANPKAVEDLRSGKKKPEAVKGFLRGQVMKITGGKADPALVGKVLERALAERNNGEQPA